MSEKINFTLNAPFATGNKQQAVNDVSYLRMSVVSGVFDVLNADSGR